MYIKLQHPPSRATPTCTWRENKPNSITVETNELSANMHTKAGMETNPRPPTNKSNTVLSYQLLQKLKLLENESNNVYQASVNLIALYTIWVAFNDHRIQFSSNVSNLGEVGNILFIYDN